MIYMSRDARTIISVRQRGREQDLDDTDQFLAFNRDITSKRYPKDFKPVNITKHDGKQDPQQWIRCYSMAVEVVGGTHSTKVLYFPMALEAAPLTWPRA